VTAAARAARVLARTGAAALALLALAVPAHAQPPSGVVRPDDERGKPALELGSELFAGNCAVCHGTRGEGIQVPRPGTGGIHGQGPPLIGAGARAADFYLRTGYMPLGRPDEQPTRRDSPFTEREIRALVAYVASLGEGPPIPAPHPEDGSLARGFRLFTEHCAGCHQVAARGGVVTGARVPPLGEATATQVAEAVRTGPFLMPKFSEKQITDAELDSIVAYVQRSKHPVDRGGWGIGNLGPVPEGMVTWLIAGLVLVAVCMVIGERARP
jgi:ubiquinol-cytochrome c reductase cytochrome c subunit